MLHRPAVVPRDGVEDGIAHPVPVRTERHVAARVGPARGEISDEEPLQSVGEAFIVAAFRTLGREPRAPHQRQSLDAGHNRYLSTVAGDIRRPPFTCASDEHLRLRLAASLETLPALFGDLDARAGDPWLA